MFLGTRSFCAWTREQDVLPKPSENHRRGHRHRGLLGRWIQWSRPADTTQGEDACR